MKTMLLLSGLVPFAMLTSSSVLAQTQDTQAQQSGAPAAPAPTPLPPAQAAAPQPLPAEAAPQGQWVNTAEYGWIWIPAGAMSYDVGNEPYVYLYTPTYGWTWYASPWGWGPYAYGPWVSGPWPYGFRVWVHGSGGWRWHHMALGAEHLRGGYFGGGHFGGAHFGGAHLGGGHSGGARVGGHGGHR